MSRTAKTLLGVVLVLIVLVVAADRIGAAVLEGKAADSLAGFSQFQAKPNVDINGVPFLTQAIAGDYDDVEITSSSVTVGEINGAKLDAHLHNASLSMSDLLGGKVTQIPVKKVDGYAVAPYSELERLSGIDGIKLSESGGKLVVDAPVTAPVVGSVQVHATGQFNLVDGKLKLAVSSLQVQGFQVPDSLIPTLTAGFNSAIDVPALPYGLHLTSTKATAGGLQLSGEADNVVLKKLS